MRSSIWVACCLLVALGCQSQTNPPVTAAQEEPAMPEVTFPLVSSAFEHQGAIPTEYTGDGADRSPPLSWSQVPDGTRQFALIADDPDAPRPEPWVHWVIYQLPGDLTELAAGIPAQAELESPSGARQGRNSWPAGIGYGGPAPPQGSGPHRYYFRLYALDEALELGAGLDQAQLLEAMDGHVLGVGELMGTYERK